MTAPLSLPDHVLVNAATWLAMNDGAGDLGAVRSLVEETVADVLPHVTRTHPLIGAIAAAAGDFHGARRTRTGEVYLGVRFALQSEIRALCMWRVDGAIDRWRAEAPDLSFFKKRPLT